VPDVLNHPQVEALGLLVDVVDGDGPCDSSGIRSPCHPSISPPDGRHPPLGEHTREVATEMGWAGDDLERTLGSGALQETRRGEE
jgi:crotonobetainyl-CoA:carnitine CoA-transferase CaiB-like acyl-CoA transferase